MTVFTSPRQEVCVGNFLAVTAVRDLSAQAVAQAIAEYARRHGLDASVLNGNPGVDSQRAGVFAPVNGWTTVLWPPYFNIHDIGAASALSDATQTLVSTMHVYDDEYWVHVLVRAGVVLDRFASRPTYFDPAREDAERLRARFAGDADVTADAVGDEADRLRPYFRHLTDDAAGGRAFPDDEFDLDDTWVIADVWRRMGITYPEPVSAVAITVDLGPGWRSSLPTADEL
jgi:hypothetical protein